MIILIRCFSDTQNDDGIKFEDLIIEDGKIKGIKGGADTVLNFSGGGNGIINITTGFNACYGGSYGWGKITCNININFDDKTATVSNLAFQIHDPGPLWLHGPYLTVNSVNVE